MCIRDREWTGVSLEGTPWPAMMALSETRPLRECDSVWERYMGQRLSLIHI